MATKTKHTEIVLPGPKEQVKVVFVGDSGAGKSVIIRELLRNELLGIEPDASANSMFEQGEAWVMYKPKKDIKVQLWAAATQGPYANLRSLSYQDADLVVYCLPVAETGGMDFKCKQAFATIVHHWHPKEASKFCRPGTPTLVLGTKADLRSISADTDSRLTLSGQDLESLAHYVAAKEFREISAANATRKELTELMHDIVRIARQGQKDRRREEFQRKWFGGGCMNVTE